MTETNESLVGPQILHAIDEEPLELRTTNLNASRSLDDSNDEGSSSSSSSSSESSSEDDDDQADLSPLKEDYQACDLEQMDDERQVRELHRVFEDLMAEAGYQAEQYGKLSLHIKNYEIRCPEIIDKLKEQFTNRDIDCQITVPLALSNLHSGGSNPLPHYYDISLKWDQSGYQTLMADPNFNLCSRNNDGYVNYQDPAVDYQDPDNKMSSSDPNGCLSLLALFWIFFWLIIAFGPTIKGV